MLSPKIVIIGAGWYGLYLAKKMLALSLNGTITIVDRCSDIFESASRYNQCRLHLGFHYPRSAETRKLCRDGFQRFMEEFGDVTYEIPNNFYAIAENSLLDFDSYCAIFAHERYDFEVSSFPALHQTDQRVLMVRERAIDPLKAKCHFQAALEGKVRFLLGCTVTGVVDEPDRRQVLLSSNSSLDFDKCYDCTNFQAPIGLAVAVAFENTITLLYRRRKNVAFGALTIMDGPFFSIFPYADGNIYSLTHVKYTVVQGNVSATTASETRSAMEQDVCQYYTTFLEDFDYVGYFFSPKTKPTTRSRADSRHLMIVQLSPNVTRVSCGKITGIFQMTDALIP